MCCFCIYVIFFSVCLFLIQATSPWLKKGTISHCVIHCVICVHYFERRNLIKLPFCVDLHWHHLCAQDTGRETLNFERGSEVAVVIEMNIMEDLAMIDLRMSALESTAACLSVTAIAPHLTVCSAPSVRTCIYIPQLC